MPLRKWSIILAIVVCLVLVTAQMVACAKKPFQPHGLYDIYIEKYAIPPGKLPIFMPSVSPIPRQTWVARTFTPGDKVLLDLLFFTTDAPVTFSRFALFDRQTSQETTLTGDLGPFGPFTDDALHTPQEGPWPVPDTPGIYELRVYQDSQIVASGLFEVVKPTPLF